MYVFITFTIKVHCKSERSTMNDVNLGDNKQQTRPRPSSTGHIHKAFYGLFHFSRQGQSLHRWKTIKPAVNSCSALFQHTPMLQQTARRTQILHEIKVEVKKEILNLRCVCWSLPGGTSTDACQTPVSCPSPEWLHATRHNRVRLNLLHLLALISRWALAETEVKLPPLWFSCFSSSHGGRVWQTHSHTCTN